MINPSIVLPAQKVFSIADLVDLGVVTQAGDIYNERNEGNGPHPLIDPAKVKHNMLYFERDEIERWLKTVKERRERLIQHRSSHPTLVKRSVTWFQTLDEAREYDEYFAEELKKNRFFTKAEFAAIVFRDYFSRNKLNQSKITE